MRRILIGRLSVGASALLVLAGLFAGQPSPTSAQVASAPLLLPSGSTGTGTGVVSPSPGGLTAGVYLIYGRPFAQYALSACQVTFMQQIQTCLTLGAASMIGADGSGKVQGSVQLPPLQELDAILMVDVVDPTDAYFASVGPNPPAFVSVGGGMMAIVLPSSVAPGICPAGFIGLIPVFFPPFGGAPVLIRCP